MFQPVWSKSNPFITRQGLWLMLTLTQKSHPKPSLGDRFIFQFADGDFFSIFPIPLGFLPGRLPKSSKYLLRKCLEGVKAEPHPHKVFGRLGLYIFLWFLNAFRFFCQYISTFWVFWVKFHPSETLAHSLGSSHSFSAAALRRPMVQESMPSRSWRRRRWRSPLRPRRQLQRKRRSWAKARPSQRGETDDLMEDVRNAFFKDYMIGLGPA